MCVHCVGISALVSFIIVVPLLLISASAAGIGNTPLGEQSVIEILVALAPAIAATFSACAAYQANKISNVFQNTEKNRLTISLSPYNSDRYIDSWEFLQKNLEEVYGDDRAEHPEICKENLSDTEVKRKFLIVLNFWGRLATAYEEELVEKELAKRMYSFGFVRFVRPAENYLRADKRRRRIYKDTLKLFSNWNGYELEQDKLDDV